MPPHHDLAIVGAGAAGLTAAIFATREAPGARVVLLDGAARIGAKILISGGGRCNVTHYEVTPADFNGNRNAIAKVLRSFPVPETVAWFEAMGVELKREETGKLFPVTDRARTVVDALLREASRAEVRTGHRVTSIAPREGGFEIALAGGGSLVASRVVLATGGRSVPKTGSDGHGFEIARSLGHTVTPVFPALVPLLLERGHFLTSLSGTSCGAELSVRSATGRVLATRRGSLLFTHFGISGPVALDVSRDWIAARRDDPGTALTASFLPGVRAEELEREWLDRAVSSPRTTVARALRERLPERLVDALAATAGTTASAPLAGMSRQSRRALLGLVLEMPLPVTGDRGFDYAEVTAGGVPLSEVDPSTMASRKWPGLYLCGEILDVDGRIGGFNFQWAWATGRLAGMQAVRQGAFAERSSPVDSG